VARLVVVVPLRGPHLVLPHASGDDCVAVRLLVQHLRADCAAIQMLIDFEPNVQGCPVLRNVPGYSMQAYAASAC